MPRQTAAAADALPAPVRARCPAAWAPANINRKLARHVRAVEHPAGPCVTKRCGQVPELERGNGVRLEDKPGTSARLWGDQGWAPNAWASYGERSVPDLPGDVRRSASPADVVAVRPVVHREQGQARLQADNAGAASDTVPFVMQGLRKVPVLKRDSSGGHDPLVLVRPAIGSQRRDLQRRPPVVRRRRDAVEATALPVDELIRDAPSVQQQPNQDGVIVLRRPVEGGRRLGMAVCHWPSGGAGLADE